MAIKKIEVDGEAVYLKRGLFGKGYRVVTPYKNDDGTINWFNALIGSYDNLLFIIGVVLFITLILLMMRGQMADSVAAINKAYELCPQLLQTKNFTFTPITENLRFQPNISLNLT